MTNNQIRHIVAFSLRFPKDSPQETQFLQDAERILTAIPQVHDFEVLRQTSPKANYDFGFSMVFANNADYEAYNNDPSHVAFVRERWQSEVAAFQEIDFTGYR